MNTRAHHPPGLPDWIVCPACRKATPTPLADLYRCPACHQTYPLESGFPSLLADPDDRFEDDLDEERNQSEENANRYSAESYYLPLFRDLFGDTDQAAPRILSCGCGVGIDVELFREQGYDAIGLDCGQRHVSWRQRKDQSVFFIGNVKSLPFADDSFDLVTTGCLLPHVGVEGDTTHTEADYEAQRLRAVREMVRVTRPGGYIVTGNPNRDCPLDLFHEGQMRSARSLARFHSPHEHFLLSLDDFERLFIAGAGCKRIKTLPIANYWSFKQKSQDGLTRFLVPIVKRYFQVLSTPMLSPLRSSALNPWLMVLITK